MYNVKYIISKYIIPRTIKVVGTTKTTEEAQKALSYLLPGDYVVLNHEKNNQYDPNAVSVNVFFNNRLHKIGYLPNNEKIGFFATDISYLLDSQIPVRALVSKVLGGTIGKENIGVRILVYAPVKESLNYIPKIIKHQSS
ncbi:HIRAN domain-containing protein [Caldisericum sp.]|uniref:HIRAN domain-containing protein n=1 Tax=Caldisericum sp. TaxID=2499687 RepID=UPI003D0E40E6